MAPKENSEDEKISDDERLDTDSEEPTGLPSAFSDSDEEDNGDGAEDKTCRWPGPRETGSQLKLGRNQDE